ncbi:MAG: MOSC domain-containing protein [Gaiellaceae bacterium]
MKTVSRLSIAPVKGLALLHPTEIALESFGVADNRRFYVIDADGRRYAQLRDGTLVRIVPAWDGARLALTFPDGSVVDGEVDVGDAVTTDFYGRDVGGRLVVGPWNDALSEFAGRRLRLVRADEPGGGVDRERGSVTMLSDASLDELGRNAGRDGVDARRFRMLIGIAGCAPHEEDEWLGGLVRVGDAVVRLHEQVARCAITTQDPDTGVPDLDTLREIRNYRGLRPGTTNHIDFGVFGDVEAPGRVRLGDAVEPL